MCPCCPRLVCHFFHFPLLFEAFHCWGCVGMLWTAPLPVADNSKTRIVQSSRTVNVFCSIAPFPHPYSYSISTRVFVCVCGFMFPFPLFEEKPLSKSRRMVDGLLFVVSVMFHFHPEPSRPGTVSCSWHTGKCLRLQSVRCALLTERYGIGFGICGLWPGKSVQE